MRDHLPAARDWDSYWQNARAAAAHKPGAPQDAPLEAFWRGLFRQLLQRAPLRLLDIACGSGAVIGHALAEQDTLQPVGLDAAAAGLAELRTRLPGAAVVAGDAAQLPFVDGAFPLVVSQFGIEYAGMAAVAEAARVTAPGGAFAAVLHLRYGGIYQECAANRDAADGFRSSGLLRRFGELYRVAAALKQGQGDREALQRADRSLGEAVKAAEDVLRRWGRGAADGVLFRIYSDIGHMYRRLGAHDPGEIGRWIARMERELDDFCGRMSAMLEAALDAPRIGELGSVLEQRGFAVRIRDHLQGGRDATTPWAWVLLAEKGQ